jgi:hypothetical protein
MPIQLLITLPDVEPGQKTCKGCIHYESSEATNCALFGDVPWMQGIAYRPEKCLSAEKAAETTEKTTQETFADRYFRLITQGDD